MRKDQYQFLMVVQTIRQHFNYEPENMITDYLKMCNQHIEKQEGKETVNEELVKELMFLRCDLENLQKELSEGSKQLDMFYDIMD